MTPWNDDHPERLAWFDREIISEGLCKFIRLDMYDNPYLDPAEIEAYLKNMTAEEMEARVHGLFTHKSGLIYKTFSRNVHVIPHRRLPDHWERFCIVDPHDRKPPFISWWAINPAMDYRCIFEYPVYKDGKGYEKIAGTTLRIADYVDAIIKIEKIFGWRTLCPLYSKSWASTSGRHGGIWTCTTRFGKTRPGESSASKSTAAHWWWPKRDG